MRNKVFVLALSVIMVLCSSFSVFASTSINVDMAEPSTSDTQGYLVTSDANGDNVNVFFWSISPYVANGELNVGTLANMNIILSDNDVTFTALYSGTARFTLTRVYNSTSQYLMHSAQFHNSGQAVYEFDNPIKYYVYSGNVGIFDDNVSSINNFLSVNWGNDKSYNQQFADVLSALDRLDNSIGNLYNKSTSINSNLGLIQGDISNISADMQTALDDLDIISNRLNELIGSVGFVIEQLRYIEAELIESNDTLTRISRQIDEFLNAKGTEDTSALDDSSLSQNDAYSDVLINDNTTGQVISGIGQMDDSLDSVLSLDGFGLAWEWVQRALLSHDKVLMLVFFCLTMGVIKLIFNR